MTKLASTFVKNLKGHVTPAKEPLSLENLVRESTQSKANWGLLQNDIAFALVFWSMVDCGFECVSREKNLPKNWKHKTRRMYEAEFFLPPYPNYRVRLVALPAGEILCINVLASDLSSKSLALKSLAIHSPGYVPRPDEDVVLSKLSDLNDFQLLLRDFIIWPIRCSILTDQGIQNGSLGGVSDEIKLKIVRQLPLKDVLMLSETCQDLNRICNDQALWKHLFHENFKSDCKCSEKSTKCGETEDWKENFKEVYVRRKKKEMESPADSFHTVADGPLGSEIDLDVD